MVEISFAVSTEAISYRVWLLRLSIVCILLPRSEKKSGVNCGQWSILLETVGNI